MIFVSLLLAIAASDPKRAPVDPDKELPAAKEPAPGEYTLAVKEDGWRVRVTLRPGQPEPGSKVELLLEVARAPDTPDPQYGDRIPLQNARLSVAMSGAGRSRRQRLWPMGDAGVYGTHWTPSARGLWTVALEPIDAKSDGAPHLEFQVGVGVPMPASSEGQAVRSTRVVRAGAAPVAASKPELSDVMRQIAAQWLKLGSGSSGADEKAALAVLAKLVDQVPGGAPRGAGADAAEFDNMARKLKADLELYAASTPEAHRGLAAAAEVDTCLRCHVKFRDGVVSDVSKWPEVKAWKR